MEVDPPAPAFATQVATDTMSPLSQPSPPRRWPAVTVGLVTLAALLTLTGVSLRLASEATKYNANARVLDTATVTSLDIERELSAVTDLVTRSAQRGSLPAAITSTTGSLAPSTTLDRAVAALRMANDGVAVAFVADSQGRLLAVSPSTPGILGVSFSYRDWFRGASTSGGKTYVSTAYRSQASGQPLVVAVVAPVLGPGRNVVGYLGAGYSLRAIQALTVAISDLRGVQVGVSDRVGTVLAGPRSTTSLQSARSDPAVAAALAGRSGVLQSADAKITAYTPVAQLGWAVTATLSDARAAAAVHQLSESVIGLAGVLVLGLLLEVGMLRASRRQRWHTENALAEHRWLLHRQETQFRALVQHSSDIIMTVGPDGLVRQVSDSILDVLGHRPDALVGQPLGKLAHPEDRAVVQGMYDADSGAQVGWVRWRARHANGGWRHVETHWSNRLGEPALRGFVLNSRDVTDRVEMEARLADQALRDPLTGLANRTLFLDRVTHALAERTHNPSRQPAVLFFDINDFKSVNDSLGHQAGDEVLTVVARRLLGTLRPHDTVARLGGDEFAVLIDTVDTPADALTLADRTRAVLHTAITVHGTELTLHVGVGVAVATAGRADIGADSMLRDADTAMHVAKHTSSAVAVLYHPDMQRDALARLELTTDLDHALERAQLSLAYQPLVDVRTGLVIGAEALLRWNHPQHGPVSPTTFIPLAEQTGLIRPIGAWALREACRQAVQWQAPGRAGRFGISVNLSGRQLHDPLLLDHVLTALDDSGLPADALTLEITESVLVTDDRVALTALHGLRGLGVRLALDDFGTGYSSLVSMRVFPLTTLKIDKIFVDAIDDDGQDLAFMQTIVELGHTLGLTVVAEGVERDGQLQRLSRAGCDIAQGFLFSAPVPAEQMSRLVGHQVAAPSAH